MLIGIDASRAAVQERTGTENYSLNLIRHLLALENGHRYRLYFNRPPVIELCGATGPLFPMMGGLELRVMPFPRLWTHLRLSWEMVRQPPDVLFVPAHVLLGEVHQQADHTKEAIRAWRKGFESTHDAIFLLRLEDL